MLSSRSLNACTPDGADLTLCSAQIGWASVLMREYRNPLCADDYRTTPTLDQRIVLITAGSLDLQSKQRGVWKNALYRPGSGGLVAPGETVRLRWSMADHHHVLQTFIPHGVVSGMAEELFGRQHEAVGPLHCAFLHDPVVSATLLSLRHAARTLAPDMHAETTAHFLISHLLLRQTRLDRKLPGLPGAEILDRVEEYMHAHISRSVSLGELADVAGVSRFQLLRLAGKSWGETPQRHLTRLRIQQGQRLLMSRRMKVVEIALECGYSNPGHFATAFRRVTGMSPSEFLLNN